MESIKYVGVEDMDIDLFESQYVVPDGVTYNSYVIMDEKIAVMDSVDRRKTDEWLKKVEETLGGKTPDYLVVSHMEPDHGGSILDFAKKYPCSKIVVNAKSRVMLAQFIEDDLSDRLVEVKEGDELALGEHTLVFYMAPMVHWPEVMVSYEKKEKVLFSADGFGKFGVHESEWDCEARRYYFNIVGKYGANVQALLKKAAGLEIKTICPLHGPILDENIGYYINKYDIWSSYRAEDEGVFVAYASIHGNTRKAAEKAAELLREGGEKKVVLCDLARCDIAEAVEDAFRYDKLLLACATYNMDMFTPMDNFLSLLKKKNYQNRRVALIENGTWAPTAAKLMRETLEKMKNISICGKTVTIKSALKKEDEDKLRELVDELLH